MEYPQFEAKKIAMKQTKDGYVMNLAIHPDDVANIFKNNRVVFDKAKAMDENFYSEMMTEFSKTKAALTKGKL